MIDINSCVVFDNCKLLRFVHFAWIAMDNCIETLPAEILGLTFSFTCVQDLAQLSLVCKVFNNVTNSEYFRNKMFFYFKILQKYHTFLDASQIYSREIFKTERDLFRGGDVEKGRSRVEVKGHVLIWMYKMRSGAWKNLFTVKLNKDQKLIMICGLCEENDINCADERMCITISDKGQTLRFGYRGMSSLKHPELYVTHKETLTFIKFSTRPRLSSVFPCARPY